MTFYKQLKRLRIIEIESRMKVTRGWGQEGMRSWLKHIFFLSESLEIFLEIICFMKVLNATKCTPKSKEENLYVIYIVPQKTS